MARDYGNGNVVPRSGGREGFKGYWGTGKDRVYVYGKTRRETRRKLNEAIALRQAGKLLAGRGPRTDEWFDLWLSEREGSVRPQTLDNYERLLGHAIPTIGHKRLRDLDANDMTELVRALRAQGLGPSTVREIYSRVSSALAAAVKRDLLLRNPARLIDTPRAHVVEKTVLTPDQTRLLLTRTEGETWHALWTLLALYGLRIGEAHALRWSDISETGIAVQGTIVNYGSVENRYRGDTKSAASRRVLPMLDMVQDALEAHRARQTRLRMRTLGWQDNDLVFSTRHGGLPGTSPAREALYRTLARLGLPRVTPHQLRHGAGTFLLSLGVDHRTIQTILGHADVALTLRIYTHPNDDMRADALKRVEGLLRGDFPVSGEENVVPNVVHHSEIGA